MPRPTLRWPRLPERSAETARRGRHISIAERLRWSYLLSSTLPLLIVGALLLSISSQNQQQLIYAHQLDQANRIARNVSNYVFDFYDQIDAYALKVRSSTTTLTQKQSFALDLQTSHYPNLIDLAVIDQSGKELLRATELQLVPNDALQDRRNEASVQRALSAGQITFSPISLNKDKKLSFIMTVPWNDDNGAIIGALRAEINAEVIAQELRISTTDSDSSAYLISNDGRTVILDDGDANFAATSELHTLLQSEKHTEQYMGAHKQRVIGSEAAVNLVGSKQSINWLVVVEQPVASAFASVWRGIFLLVLLIALVAGIALVWAFRQTRHFLRPLNELGTGAKALGAGQLEYRIDVPSDDELGDLAHLFNQMAEHLQQLLAEIEHQNDRLRHGLALARDIQVGLLPDRVPWSEDTIDVYARSIPAYEVGGDFYTYLALSEGRSAFAIGDISGKGVGAALLMALTSSTVESQGRELEYPAKVLTALNKLLAPRLKASHMNAALMFVVFDPNDCIVRVANAGMIAPILLSQEGNQFIDVGGLPIGAFPGAIYLEQAIHLNPGDALLLLSDGVVEAHNAQGELFGFERLEAIIAETPPQVDVRALVETVIERVQVFMGDTEQHDDLTLVAIRPALPVDGTIPIHDEERTIRYATV